MLMETASQGKLISNSILEEMLKRYKYTKKPQQIDFRELVHWVQFGNRATHLIHQYPAKLLAHIPYFFLANDILSQKNDFILDPFCGSGTLLLETILANKKPIGSDSNPLARLISKVKSTPISNKRLINAFLKLQEDIDKNEEYIIPDVVNIDYWFYPHVIIKLSKIKYCIDKIKDEHIRDFFRVSLSNTIKKVSLADPHLSVPVKLRHDKHPKKSPRYKLVNERLNKLKRINVYSVFYGVVDKNIKRMSKFNELININPANVAIFNDARDLSSKNKKIKTNSVQLIITSPPYAGAQKYIRSSSLNMGWLDLCSSRNLREHEDRNIGREHHHKHNYINYEQCGIKDADRFLKELRKENPLRAHIASKYLNEMKDAFAESYRVLKKDGYFVLIAAPNNICGKVFNTHKYLSVIAKKLGLKLRLELIDDIRSRGLMTKRNKAANVINSEWVYVFQK